ncbi:MAG TPA: methyltransferase domain-containing protein [Methylomirabilota bacterium]
MWNRLRYTFWAPVYDAMTGAVGFEAARRRSIALLGLTGGDRVLVVGAGTGLDLLYVPDGVETVAVDLTPAMLRRLTRRAERASRRVGAHVMDARQLGFPDASFEAVVMHLVLSVMDQPDLGLREAARVLRPGGRVAVFDKFLGDRERPTVGRRLLNLIARPLFSDMNRRLGPLLAGTSLVVEHDEPAGFGGMYRIVTLGKRRQDANGNR